MGVTLPLEEMSVEEKLHAMETIWDDLCRHEGGVPVPDWHRQVLDERERACTGGEAKVMDWEAAKRDILQRTK